MPKMRYHCHDQVNIVLLQSLYRKREPFLCLRASLQTSSLEPRPSLSTVEERKSRMENSGNERECLANFRSGNQL